MINSAIADIIGSAYEGRELKGFNLPFLTRKSEFTDDTVLMVATADLLMKTREKGIPLINLTSDDFARHYKLWGNRYPNVHYSPQFKGWLESDSMEPIYSLGSGVTSRAFPIAWVADSLEEAMEVTARSAGSTHAAPEANVAACAISYTIYLLLQGDHLDEIKNIIESKFFIPMTYNWEELHKADSFSTNAEDVAGLGLAIGTTARSHEDGMRLVLYVGGDTDTIGAVAMAVLDARFPGGGFSEIEGACREMIGDNDGDRLIDVIDRFDAAYMQ
mgnify:CR=1 FL=1